MELQEALIVRFDAWTSSKFPQWLLSANENYIKHYINEKVSSIGMCKLVSLNNNRSCLIHIHDMIAPHSPKVFVCVRQPEALPSQPNSIMTRTYE